MDKERYKRQIIIPGWEQNKLKKSKILILGIGAIGNEVIKNLAAVGIGQLILVDMDIIDTSNLNRTVLFTKEDVGKPKVEVAAKKAKKINPELELETIQGDIFFDVGKGIYRRVDLVIGCLDSISAKSLAAQNSHFAGVPYLDGGMWAFGGEAKWFLPGQGFCYDCTLDSVDLQQANIRKSCTGFKIEEDSQPQATNISTTSIIGGLLAQEAVKYLLNLAHIDSSEAIVYNGLKLSMHNSILPGEDECVCKWGNHSKAVIELPSIHASSTVESFFSQIKSQLAGPLRLDLGRDLIIGWTCDRPKKPHSDQKESLNPPFAIIAKTSEVDRECPYCLGVRDPEILSFIEENSPYSSYTFQDLGIPTGDIVTVWNENVHYYAELTGDLLEG